MKKEKEKAKGSNSTLLIGGGLGVLAIGLIVGGYFAFFAGDDKPSGEANKSGEQKQDAGKEKPTGKYPPGKADPKKDPGMIDPKNPGGFQNPGGIFAQNDNPDAFAQMSNLLPEDSQWVFPSAKTPKKLPSSASS